MSDACVVGVQDDYHGDMPIAFVVPSAAAAARIAKDASEVEKTKTVLKQVRPPSPTLLASCLLTSCLLTPAFVIT